MCLQLRDYFPHPYSIDNARGFIAFASGADPETALALTVNDAPVGAIGVTLRDDVERCSTEIGYWLGEPYWCRGIATRALAGFTPYAFETYSVGDPQVNHGSPSQAAASSCDLSIGCPLGPDRGN